MEIAVRTLEPAQINAVALKAYARVADAWGLSVKQAAALADLSESTWKRAKKPDFGGELTKDQLLRLSAVIGIYKSLDAGKTWARLGKNMPFVSVSDLQITSDKNSNRAGVRVATYGRGIYQVETQGR